MADVEMDLDPSRNIGHDDHIDEDLIEYDLDTDIMDGTNNTEWTTEDLEIQDAEGAQEENHVDNNTDMEAMLEEALEHPPDTMDTLDVLPLPGNMVNDADMLSDVGHEDNKTQGEDVDAGHQEELLEGEAIQVSAPELGLAEPDEPHLGELGEASGDAAEVAEAIEQVEEIDFGTGPGAETEDAASATADAVDTESRQTAMEETVQSSPEVDRTKSELQETPLIEVEEEELTWEEEDEAEGETGAAGAPETVKDEQSITTGGTQQPSHPEQPTQAAIVESEIVEDDKPVVEGVQDDANEFGVAQPDDKVTNEEQPEVTERATVEKNLEDASYPSVTVQYKGEDFPCFAASEGFFTSTSVMEESIDRLLAGFRAELAGELASDEELVFHVDELGLEFAESSQHDLLTGTTLQYLMEIYDMLAQNQDPDHDAGSKGLYTYLFTRSSTRKRLDFLAESAASGKGLDEVIHLFEPAMQHQHINESPINIAVLDEHGDDYPSPGDEPDEVDYEEEEILQEETEHAASSASFIEDSGTAPVEDAEAETAGLAEESTLVSEAIAPIADQVSEVPDEAPANSVQSAATDGPDQNEVEPPETHKANEYDAFDVDHDQSGHLDATQVLDGPVTATSASSTVDGNETPVIDAADGGVEYQNGDQGQHQADDDDLVEIDWREEGEEGEDIAAAVDQTTPAKRSRAEDGIGADEENDAKRQRSS